MDAREALYDDPYRREVVMARVGHLIRRKQQEVEKITRIIRACFDPGPISGRITNIILIGPYARRTWYEDAESICFSDYEFWVVVDEPAATHERHWYEAERVIERELGRACAVTLQILSRADVTAARIGRDHFILDRIEAGITLHEAGRDAPLTEREATWWQRKGRRHG